MPSARYRYCFYPTGEQAQQLARQFGCCRYVMLEYKAAWYGKTVVKVDRFSPSSKMCSNCGYVVERWPLSIRAWTCRRCRAEHCRDVNAAKNILAAGLAATAFGESGRPALASAGGAALDEEGIPRLP